MLTVDEIIKALNLQPLPVEGGMYRETYVAKNNSDGKPISTAIYYLLTGEAFSHMHRLPTDEVYHFYLGDGVELLELLPDGGVKTTVLGNDLTNGEQPQYVVPAGVWQGSRLVKGGSFALLGTTMAPGYIDSDYEHGERSQLCREYPQAKEFIIERTEGFITK